MLAAGESELVRRQFARGQPVNGTGRCTVSHTEVGPGSYYAVARSKTIVDRPLG
jgi:hypothetical protein